MDVQMPVHIFAVETAEELASYQAFVRRTEEKLRDYIAVLEDKYAAEDLPRAIVWTGRRTATELLSDLPVPAYTNERRIVFCPELSVWRELYLAQLDGLSGEAADRVCAFYETRLTEDHVLQILGHELAHHSGYFSDEDYEAAPWFEEGMAEYISRRELLTEAEFTEKAGIEGLLLELLAPRYGKREFAPGAPGNYAGIFYDYWRGFQAARERVEAQSGDVLAALRQGPAPAEGKEDHTDVQL